MTNGFDKIIDYGFDENVVRYGIKYGGDRVVFIKAGLGGGIPGYEGKYLKIADRLNEKHGCTVICASNTQEITDQTLIDKFAIDELMKDRGIVSPELYFFGHSNGGIKGLDLTRIGLSFKKMMLVNMPLMINMFKTKAMISAIPETSVSLIYGELDPSVPYIPFFDGKLDNVSATVFLGADHNFSGFLDEFIHLADGLFMDFKRQLKIT